MSNILLRPFKSLYCDIISVYYSPFKSELKIAKTFWHFVDPPLVIVTYYLIGPKDSTFIEFVYQEKACSERADEGDTFRV
jgi:hypothetical protein